MPLLCLDCSFAALLMRSVGRFALADGLCVLAKLLVAVLNFGLMVVLGNVCGDVCEFGMLSRDSM